MEYQFESLGPTLRIVALVFLIVFVLLLLAFVVVVAALPGQIARSRHHPQAAAINICGWLGLPTGILWVVAMVWAFLKSGSIGLAEETTLVGSRQLMDEIMALENSVNKLELKQKESRS